MARRSFRSLLHFSYLGAVVVYCGCGGGPSRVAAPEWDPDGVADRAIEMLDKDGDGKVSEEEVKEAPGLAYPFPVLDTDGDKALSREEIETRIQEYADSKVAFTDFKLSVTFNGRPLQNAEVRLVPEPFLGEGVVNTATGITDSTGSVRPDAGSELSVPLSKIGMYRVEVTSPRVDIPQHYNTDTTLGVEVSPFTDTISPGGVVLHLSSR